MRPSGQRGRRVPRPPRVLFTDAVTAPRPPGRSQSTGIGHAATPAAMIASRAECNRAAPANGTIASIAAPAGGRSTAMATRQSCPNPTLGTAPSGPSVAVCICTRSILHTRAPASLSARDMRDAFGPLPTARGSYRRSRRSSFWPSGQPGADEPSGDDRSVVALTKDPSATVAGARGGTLAGDDSDGQLLSCHRCSGGSVSGARLLRCRSAGRSRPQRRNRFARYAQPPSAPYDLGRHVLRPANAARHSVTEPASGAEAAGCVHDGADGRARGVASIRAACQGRCCRL